VLPPPALSVLRRHAKVDLDETDRPLPPAELRARLRGCAGLLCLLTDRVDEAALSTPGLRAVANVAVGFDNIDISAATRFGVLVTNTPDVLTESTADFAFALMLAAARRLGEGERLVRAGGFHGWGLQMMLGRDVCGATLGVVGFGRIGQAVARRARGFGMRVQYSDPRRVPEAERETGARRVSFGKLLETSDFVSLHVPLSDATRHLVGAAELARMRPDSVLVNTSRGPVVDERALVRALRAGRPAAAGLDVYEHEPRLAPGLDRLENAVLAPHLGSATVATRTRMACLAAENLVAALAGRRPPNLVNPEAWRS